MKIRMCWTSRKNKQKNKGRAVGMEGITGMMVGMGVITGMMVGMVILGSMAGKKGKGRIKWTGRKGWEKWMMME
jgi:hypothetical protein